MKQIYFAIAGMLIASFLGSCAQLVLKSANVQFDFSAVTNWRLWLFGLLYGVGVLINIWAYRYGSPSVLYPVIALSYVWVVVLSVVFLGDVFSWQKVLGSGVVVCGVVLIATS